MLLIGLTGGIASGKTTVASLLASKGATIIDADQIGHAVLRDPQIVASLVNRFGDQVLADSEIDRAKLATIVFSDRKALGDLNAITHPAIYEEILRSIESHRDEDKLVVLDAPLLVETLPDRGASLGLQALVVVSSFPDDQLARMIDARGMHPADAESRIAAQASSSAKLAAADYVIHNRGSLQDLEANVEVLWNDLWATYS